MSQHQSSSKNRIADNDLLSQPLRAEGLAFADYPLIENKVKAGIERGHIRVLLTDVDATLVLGSGHTPKEIEQSHENARKLIKLLNDQGAVIIPVTGSHFESATSTTSSVSNRIHEGVLPHTGSRWLEDDFRVDAYVTDGGAKAIRAEDGADISYDQRYDTLVTPGGIDYERLLEHALSLASQLSSSELIALNWDVIRDYDLHSGDGRFFLQQGTLSREHESSNKIALYFYACSLEDRDYIEAQFSSKFSPFGMKIVCCEEKDANSNARRLLPEQSVLPEFPLKYCLDIVPYNKANAVEYFSAYINHLIGEQALALGYKRPTIELWACGDSGNDFPLMAFNAVTHVVMVGGASEELLRRAGRLRDCGKLVYTETQDERLGPSSILNALETL